MDMRNSNWWYKEHKICTYCKKRTARKGMATCIDCAEKDAERYLKRPPRTTEQKYRTNERIKRYKGLLVAFGVCQICGKKDALKNHTMCLECSIRRNRASGEQREKKGSLPQYLRLNNGYCYFCCKKIDSEQSLCDECRAKKVKCMEYARTFIDREKMRAIKRKWLK